jgi:TM2 domain-containing membrane protein YozV
MAKNYSGDKEYQREVRARGGHRTEAGYERWNARKNRSSGDSYSVPKKIEDYCRWKDEENKYEGFFVIEKRISKEQFLQIKSELEKVPFERACLIGKNRDYYNSFAMIITSILFGYIGIDRFALGQIGIGILKFLTFGGASCWWIIDIFRMPTLVRAKNFKIVKEIINEFEKESMFTVSENTESSSTEGSVNENIKYIFKESGIKDFDSDDFQRVLFCESDSSKIENVKEHYNVSKNDIFIFAYDDTIRKNFKEGFLLTSNNLYYTEKGEKSVIAIKEINELRLESKGIAHFIIVNGHKISITSLLSDERKVLFSVLEKMIFSLKNQG